MTRTTIVNLVMVTVCFFAAATQGTIQIFNPMSLKEAIGSSEDGVIEAGLANFGHIDYGSSIVSSCQHRALSALRH